MLGTPEMTEELGISDSSMTDEKEEEHRVSNPQTSSQIRSKAYLLPDFVYDLEQISTATKDNKTQHGNTLQKIEFLKNMMTLC